MTDDRIAKRNMLTHHELKRTHNGPHLWFAKRKGKSLPEGYCDRMRVTRI